MGKELDFAEEFKRKHRGDFITLWGIYKLNKRFWHSYQLWGSLILAIILVSLVICLKRDEYAFLVNFTNRIISILPNVLGFNLAGYILLISANSDEILKELSSNEDEGYSFFQHASSIYAWSVFIQAFTFVSAFVISLVVDLHITGEYPQIINLIVLFTITFLSIYSMLLIIRLILNVFGFSQTIHFFVKLKELTKKH